MFFVVGFCTFVVLLGLLDSLGKLKRGLEVAFAIIIVVSGLRYNFGADYMNYLQLFNEIASYSSLRQLFGSFDSLLDNELGWVLLCWIFKPFGFNALILFTSIVTNVVYYKFIKSHVSPKWYWLALFVYMFNPYLFFVPLSMMRQSLAMVVFVYSFRFIANKKIFPAFLLVMFAALFHKSALVLLPFIFLGYLSNINSKVVAIAYASLSVLLVCINNLSTNIILSAMSLSPFESYAVYFTTMEPGDAFGLGFMAQLITLFVPTIFYYSDESQQFSNRLTVLISGFTFLVAPFTLIMGFLGRIDYYFIIYSIVAIPLLFSWIKKRLIRNGVIAVYIAYIIYSFHQFFKIPDWLTFTHYQTFLFQ